MKSCGAAKTATLLMRLKPPETPNHLDHNLAQRPSEAATNHHQYITHIVSQFGLTHN